MPRKPRTERPSEVVMDELAGKQPPWDLEKHLNGCLAGYQIDPSYGAAVFFALEALWGISRNGELLARNGKLAPEQLDADWTISPKTNRPVPWIWIHSLAEAWERYKTRGGPLGHAFGLEGGQGKSPTIDKLAQMLDERAIARWMWSRLEEARATDKEFRIEDVVQEAAEKFDKSDGTIRRAWQRFGDLERLRPPNNHDFPEVVSSDGQR